MFTEGTVQAATSLYEEDETQDKGPVMKEVTLCEGKTNTGCWRVLSRGITSLVSSTDN